MHTSKDLFITGYFIKLFPIHPSIHNICTFLVGDVLTGQLLSRSKAIDQFLPGHRWGGGGEGGRRSGGITEVILLVDERKTE